MVRGRKKVYLVLGLCILLIVNCMDLSCFSLSSKAAQTSVLPEAGHPTCDIEKPKVYRIEDADDVVHVPCYDSSISLYRRSGTIFEKGTGNYGFSILSANQKIFYTSLENSLWNFNNSNATDFEKVTWSDNSVSYTPFKVNYKNAGLSDEQMKQTWIAFRADHPWMFWLSGAYGVSGSGDFMPLVSVAYEKDMSAKKAMENMIETGAQKYISAVAGIDSTYERVRIIYDKLIRSVNYAYKADGTPEDADWAHTIIGVFDSRYGTVVCEGYARAFAFLLNILDIPNVYVVGDAKGGHAWNAVSFDGGETYYYVDATWDDWGGKSDSYVENGYVYYAMPKNIFEKSHTPNTPDKKGFDWQYAMPVIGNNMDYTYFIRYAAYAENSKIYDASSAKTFLKGARALVPDGDCLMLVEDKATLGFMVSALGVTSYRHGIADGYDMLLYTNPVNGFYPSVPANAFSFTDQVLTVDKAAVAEKELGISSPTANSDDYITFSSSDEKVAVVKTPYGVSI